MKLGDTNSQTEMPLVQYGTAVIMTDVYGSANVPFGTPFANASRQVASIDGDVAALSFWTAIVAPGDTASGFTVSCTTAAGPAANVTLRINWIATGPRP
jgi:hypothetical protein